MMGEVLNSAPGGYLAFRDDGLILHINDTLSAWLGYQPEELTGKSIETIFALATRIFYNTHFFPLVKLHGKADEIFLSLLSKEKQDVPVLINAERKSNGDTYIIHCICIRVHQRKKYEEEILKAKREAENALKENKQLEVLKNSLEQRTLELDLQYQKQLSINKNLLQFSKIISHDFQEPLRKIQLFSQLIALEEKDSLRAKSKTAIQKINTAAERLRLLVDGIQQYLGVSSEGGNVAVDLNAVVESAKTKVLLHRQTEEFDLVCDSLPVIEGYKVQLELLFFHLIDNAIQFQDKSRKLLIQISSTTVDENIYRVTTDKYKFTEHVRIQFTDNGVGFENEYRDYVLELLNKLNPVTEGLGMGLSLIKKIVDNHSGSLTIESKQDTGTSFVVILPARIDRSPPEIKG
jgi:phosphoserine phosphatase RsbU/P